MYKDAAVGFGELSKKFEDLVSRGGRVERANALSMLVRCPVFLPFAPKILLGLILEGGNAYWEVGEDA